MTLLIIEGSRLLPRLATRFPANKRQASFQKGGGDIGVTLAGAKFATGCGLRISTSCFPLGITAMSRPPTVIQGLSKTTVLGLEI